MGAGPLVMAKMANRLNRHSVLQISRDCLGFYRSKRFTFKGIQLAFNAHVETKVGHQVDVFFDVVEGDVFLSSSRNQIHRVETENLEKAKANRGICQRSS